MGIAVYLHAIPHTPTAAIDIRATNLRLKNIPNQNTIYSFIALTVTLTFAKKKLAALL